MGRIISRGEITVSELYDGTGVEDVVTYYLATSLSTGVKHSTSGWTTTIQQMTATNKYLWSYTLTTFTDKTTIKTDPTIIGTRGVDGSSGSSSYTWIRYSANADGSNMTTSSQSNTKYIGVAITTSSTAPTSNTSYSWSLIKGEDGKDGKPGEDGKDGNGIKTTLIEYAISTSAITAPTSGWKETMPTLEKGKYLWTRTTWTYTNNSTKVGYSVAYIPKDGEGGAPGTDAPIITKVITQYYLSDSPTSQVGGSWVTTPKEWNKDKYYWTRVQTTFNNGTIKYSDPILDAGLNQSLVSALEAKTDTANLKTTVEQYPGQWKAAASSAANTAQKNAEKTAKGYVDGIEVGGRNLWVESDTLEGYGSSSGGPKWPGAKTNPNTSQRFMKTLVEVKNHTSITYQCWNPDKIANSDNTNRVVFLKEDKTVITSTDIPKLNSSEYQTVTITIPSNTYYLRIGVVDGTGKAPIHNPNIYFQYEFGTKPTSYQPALEDARLYTAYANSLDGTVDFTREWPRENLVTIETSEPKSATWTGWNYYVQRKIPVTVGKTYTASAYIDKPNNDNGIVVRLFAYDSTDTIISESPNYTGIDKGESGVSSVAYTAPANTSYFDLAIRKMSKALESVTLDYSHVKLELGSTATPYLSEPDEDSEDYKDQLMNSFMQYTGYSPIDSDNPKDYMWEATKGNMNELKQAQIDITPDAIYQKVSSQEEFSGWMSDMESKPTADDLDAVNKNLDDVNSDLYGDPDDETSKGLVTRTGDLEVTTGSISGNLDTVVETVGKHGTTVENINNYFTFKKNPENERDAYLEIGGNQDNFSMKLSRSELGFYDGTDKVAYISNKQFYFSEGVVTDQLRVNDHSLVAGANGHTYFQYNGD